MVAQRAVHVIEVREIVVLDVAVEARILLAERVLRVERVVAAMLAGDEGDHVGAARRNAVAVVDMRAVLEHAVHHTGSVDRAEAAADIDHRRPVRHTSVLSRSSRSGLSMIHDFTRVMRTFAIGDRPPFNG